MVKYSQHKKKSHSSRKATQRLYILVSKYLRTRLVEDPPLVNLAAPQTLRTPALSGACLLQVNLPEPPVQKQSNKTFENCHL